MPRRSPRPKATATNRVRLIGGSHRGRWVGFPDVAGLRPSADRIRETLFNWLQPRIEGAVCLDLFAGSGAIGFEALSRGAGRVMMVEREARVVTALRQNQEALALDRLEIIQADALTWLTACRTRFDLIFLDPPFAGHFLPDLLPLLVRQDMLNIGAAVYFEMDSTEPFPDLPAGLEPLREKRAGQVRYGLLSHKPGNL